MNHERKIILEHKEINSKLQQKVEKLESEKIETSKKLTESKLLEANTIKKLENKVKTLESKNIELQNTNNSLNESVSRFKNLSFTPIGNVSAMKENYKMEQYSDEDQALFNILTHRN